MLEKTLESPLDCKEFQPVHSKGDKSWDFFGKNDAKLETPVLWPLHAKCWLIGKDFVAGRDWGQKEKGKTEDKMAGWHHWHDGREFEWTVGVGDGQAQLACCNSSRRQELDITELLNWSQFLSETSIIVCAGMCVTVWVSVCALSARMHFCKNIAVNRIVTTSGF